MPRYEIEMGGHKYEIEADNAQQLNVAIEQISTDASQGRPMQDFPAWQQPLVAAHDIARLTARGLTFGYSDELAAGIGAATGIGGTFGDYGANLDTQRAAEERAGLAGTVATGLGGVRSAIALGGATLSGRLPASTTMLNRTGAGIVDGGILGAFTGFGMGEGGFNNRAQNAMLDSAVGGGLGGVFGLAAGAIPRAIQSIANRRATAQAAQSIGIRPDVADVLANTMGADQTLGAAGAANMARAGSDAMLVDAGEASRGLLDTIIQSGGRGANLARNAISDRADSAARALNTALDTSFGEVGAISNMPRANIDPLYRKAYSRPIDYTSEAGREIETIVKDRVPQSAITAANSLMRAEGAQSKQILAQVDSAGNVIGYETLPDVMQLDYITRGLNQVAEASNGLGALGGKTPLGRAYGNLAREIRTNLKELVPEYAHALDAAGTEIGKVKATEFGATLFNTSVTRADVRDFTTGLPNIEKRYLMQSVRDTVDERAAQTVRAVTDGEMPAREAVKSLRDLSSRSNRQKITSILGEDQAKPLFNELDRVATSFELRGRVAQGSQTASRLIARENMQAVTDPGPVGQLMRGRPVEGSRRITQYITETTPRQDVMRNQEIAAQVADLLTRPASQSQAVFDALSGIGAQSQANLVRFGNLEATLARRLGRLPGHAVMAIDSNTADMRGRNARR